MVSKRKAETEITESYLLMQEYIQSFAGELLGTFILVFFGISAVAVTVLFFRDLTSRMNRDKIIEQKLTA